MLNNVIKFRVPCNRAFNDTASGISPIRSLSDEASNSSTIFCIEARKQEQLAKAYQDFQIKHINQEILTSEISIFSLKFLVE